MKCPYRKYTKYYENKSNGYCAKHSNDTYEYFQDCYKDECPLYSNGKCARVEKEKKEIK